jgi:hypothetical protein
MLLVNPGRRQLEPQVGCTRSACAIRVTRRIVPLEPRSPLLSVCWKVTRTDSSTVASGGDAVQVTNNAGYTSFEFVGWRLHLLRADHAHPEPAVEPADFRRRSRQGAGGNCSRQLRDRGRHYLYLTGPRSRHGFSASTSRPAGPRRWHVTPATWTFHSRPLQTAADPLSPGALLG